MLVIHKIMEFMSIKTPHHKINWFLLFISVILGMKRLFPKMWAALGN